MKTQEEDGHPQAKKKASEETNPWLGTSSLQNYEEWIFVV